MNEPAHVPAPPSGPTPAEARTGGRRRRCARRCSRSHGSRDRRACPRRLPFCWACVGLVAMRLARGARRLVPAAAPARDGRLRRDRGPVPAAGAAAPLGLGEPRRSVRRVRDAPPAAGRRTGARVHRGRQLPGHAETAPGGAPGARDRRPRPVVADGGGGRPAVARLPLREHEPGAPDRRPRRRAVRGPVPGARAEVPHDVLAEQRRSIRRRAGARRRRAGAGRARAGDGGTGQRRARRLPRDRRPAGRGLLAAAGGAVVRGGRVRWHWRCAARPGGTGGPLSSRPGPRWARCRSSSGTCGTAGAPPTSWAATRAPSARRRTRSCAWPAGRRPSRFPVLAGLSPGHPWQHLPGISWLAAALLPALLVGVRRAAQARAVARGRRARTCCRRC